MTSVIICGDRRHTPFTPAHLEWLTVLRERLAIDEVIEGGAQYWDQDRQCWLGADYHARAWAKGCGIDARTFWANWERHGKAAGPLRNEQMCAYLVERRLWQKKHVSVIAFNGGGGTSDMVRRATQEGIQVYAWHIYEATQYGRI